MKLPDDVTQETLAEWDKTMKADAMYRDFSSSEFMKHIYYAGTWLTMKLDQLGASAEDITSTCFAMGQRCFGQSDPWPVAQEALEKYRAGKPDTPGPVLAKKIHQEIFGKS